MTQCWAGTQLAPSRFAWPASWRSRPHNPPTRRTRGCQVVLCLATPGSPTKYVECVPPITKLWNALAIGGSFPTCTGVGVKMKKAKHGYELTVTQADGGTSRYALDTRYQTVTQQ